MSPYDIRGARGPGGRSLVTGAVGGGGTARTVDNFEDSDATTTSNGDWGDWTGDTGALSNTTSTVLSGTQSGKLQKDDSSVGVTTTRRKRRVLNRIEM